MRYLNLNKLEEKKREERIENEVVVDCYNSEEQLSSWYYYLEDKLDFPFEAIWKSAEDSVEENVRVIAMSDFLDCEDEKDMIVEIEFEGEILEVSLFEIFNPKANHETVEAIEDWHYWVNSGNRFDDDDFY